MGNRLLKYIARYLLKEQELHISSWGGDRVRWLELSIPAIPLYFRLINHIQSDFLKVCAFIVLFLIYPTIPKFIIGNKIDAIISDTKKAKNLRKSIKLTTVEYWIISIVLFIVSVLLALLINFGLSTIGL